MFPGLENPSPNAVRPIREEHPLADKSHATPGMLAPEDCGASGLPAANPRLRPGAWQNAKGRGVTGSALLHLMLFGLLATMMISEPAIREPAPFLEASLLKPGGDQLETGLATDFSLSGGASSENLHQSMHAPELAESWLDPDLVVPDLQSEGSRATESGTGTVPGLGVGLGNSRRRKPAGKNAVQRGSFTAWTEPEDPVPGENYLIVIEVRLPDKVLRFPRADLSGLVIGTDGWRQRLPGQTDRYHQFLPVEDHVTQIEIEVPGAGRRVQDTIQIRSRMLKEEQVLKIVF